MESSGFFRQVLEASPIAVVLTGPGGVIDYINPYTSHLFQYEPGELTGQSLNLILPEALTHQSPDAGFIEIQGLCRNGSHIPLEVSSSEIRSATKVLVAWSIKDLSDKKMLLHDLRERIKEQLTLLHVTETFFHNREIDTAIADSLKYVQDGWQYPEFTAVRIRLSNGKEFKTSNFSETKWGLNATILSDGEAYGLIEVFYTTEFPLYGDTPFLKEEERLINGLSRLFGLFIDQRLTIEKLRESEAWIRNIAEQIPGNTYQFEMAEDGTITTLFSSRGTDYPFGLLAETREPGWFNKLVHPEDLPGFLENLKLAMKNRTNVSIQYRIVVDQQISWRWLTAKREELSDGKVIWFGYTQDITKLIEYISTLEQILFDISHVMRRPVASILGLTSLIDKDTGDGDILKAVSSHFRSVATEMDEYMKKLNVAYQKRLDMTASESSLISGLLSKK